MDINKQQMLFSKRRLDSYNSLEEHFNNLVLIGKIAPKLLVIEICIRNIVNDILKARHDINWIENEEEAEYLQKNLNNHQLVSRQNLGFWCKMIKKHSLYNAIFTFSRDFDFKKYSSINKNSYKIHNKTYKIRNSHKAEILINWIHTIRNRAFHAENLLKTRNINHKNTIAPRITTYIEFNERKIYFGVMPDKIECFLYDCLGLLDSDLHNYMK